MIDSSRRNFLIGAAGLTGVAATGGARVAVAAPPAKGSGHVRYDPLLLDLSGSRAAVLSAADGGEAYADVVEEPDGRKHIGKPRYGEITTVTGAGQSPQLYDWVRSLFDRTALRRSGSIVQLDSGSEHSRLQFADALVTEVGMPALDAASKDVARMTVKFKPELTRRQAGSRQPVDVPKDHQKSWLPSNFRLRIDGLDEACARVGKIDALTIKQKVTESAVGELRDYEKEPAKIEVPNLVIALAESHAKPLYAWHEDFVVNGNNGQDQERGGSLEYLASALRTVLFTLTFSGLGIFKLAPDKSEAGAEGVRRVKAEMYCEDVRFAYSGA